MYIFPRGEKGYNLFSCLRLSQWLAGISDRPFCKTLAACSLKILWNRLTLHMETARWAPILLFIHTAWATWTAQDSVPRHAHVKEPRVGFREGRGVSLASLSNALLLFFQMLRAQGLHPKATKSTERHRRPLALAPSVHLELDYLRYC